MMMGWKLLVKWKDGSESWIKLSDLKESHPVEVAEFAKACGISDQSAFVWWVPYMLQEQGCDPISCQVLCVQDDTQVWNRDSNQC